MGKRLLNSSRAAVKSDEVFGWKIRGKRIAIKAVSSRAMRKNRYGLKEAEAELARSVG